MPQEPFTTEEKEQISKAVAAAEAQTSGEIVTYFVEKSDDYSQSPLRGGLMAILLASFGLLAYHHLDPDWTRLGPFESILVLVCVLLFGVGISFLPIVKKMLAGREFMQDRVQARAMSAFLSEEVFDTADRTGILIFISQFEKMVTVIGDSGINAKVEQSEWDAVVDTIILGMKNKQKTKAIVDAIGQCGVLLQKKGVKIKTDDSNELKDSIRIGT